MKTWAYAALAVLLGALTHVVWDGFTHEDARVLPLLGEGGAELGGNARPFYRWLQHGSTVVGALALLTALWLWIRHARRFDPPPERRLPLRERRCWMALYVLIPVLLVVAAPINQNGWRHLHATAALTLLAVTGLRGAGLGLAFTSALIRRRLLVLGDDRAHRA